MKINANYEKYRKEINFCEDYVITKKEFLDWLDKNEKNQDFGEAIFTAFLSGDLYTVAVDFSIPVIMVKALWKEYL